MASVPHRRCDSLARGMLAMVVDVRRLYIVSRCRYANSMIGGGDPETRLRILEAGRRLIERHPRRSISIGAVAKAAGVSRQAAYLHFGSRSQLFCEIARHVDTVERTPDQPCVDEALTGKDALPRSGRTGAVRLHGRLEPRLHAVASAMDAQRNTDEAADDAWKEREHARLTRCRQVTQRLAKEHALATELDAAGAAQLMWALTSRRVWEDLVVDQRWSDERYEREVTRGLERMLLDRRPGTERKLKSLRKTRGRG
jgi:AcrR family transcriptional regulator